MNAALIERLRHRHAECHGGAAAVIAYAPGRVEILGNHTDYNDGYVLSAAIDAGVAVALSASPDAACRLCALDIGEDLCCEWPVVAPVAKPMWANYVLGVAAKLALMGGVKLAHGFKATVAGDIPFGAGLSSSAALEVATALAVQALYRCPLPPLQVARICQAAEHDFVGTKCGLLDQISALFGWERALVFTDFRAVQVEQATVAGDACFVVADTHVKHALVDSAYNERRAACEQAAAYFARILPHPAKALRDVSQEEFRRHAGGLDAVVARRAAHVIGENQRVVEGRRRLAAGDLRGFGALMYASHESSRVHFENSCPELDALVDAARALPAVCGARLSGGGFGGSVVVLTDPAEAPSVQEALAQRYQAKVGRTCATRVVTPSAGARVVLSAAQPPT